MAGDVMICPQEFMFTSRRQKILASWTSAKSFTPKALKTQREELEIRQLSPDYVAANDLGRMKLLKQEANQDMKALIVKGKHSVVAKEKCSSRR